MNIIVDDEAVRKNSAAAVAFFIEVEQAVTAVEGVSVAFDCEGVDLCRAGTLELVTVSFADHSTFVVDFQGQLARKRIAALKRLFESTRVKKVIHDCRMDCDALYHLYQIQLENVHDTSCFHHVITGTPDVSLNDVLRHNGLQENVARDKSVYQGDPAFWDTRPLTPRMIRWASNDVSKLLDLKERQLSALLVAGDIARAKQLSTENTTAISSRNVTTVPCKIPIGRLIGHRGSNIRRLQRETDTFLFQNWNSKSFEKRFFVFYKTETGLNRVKRAMGN